MNATHFDAAAPDSRKALLDAVNAYLTRTGMAPSAFSGAALDNHPSFVAGLRDGADVRLDTADSVLARMGEPPIGPRFRAEVRACIGVTGTKPYVLGEEALGDPSFVTRLLDGALPMLSTVDTVRAWMAKDADEAVLRAMEVAAARALARAAKSAGEEPTGMKDRMMDDRMMNTGAAADYLGLSPRTLDTYRWAGTGPDFYKMGRRVCYRRSGLDEWAAERRRRSTSDDGGGNGRTRRRPRRPRDGAPAKPGVPSAGKEGDRPEV